MTSEKMTYNELRNFFIKHNDNGGLENPISGYIVFSESNWPDRHYPESSRTYEISSGNNAFRSSCYSTSLFGSCLDGTDQMVRLDWYMENSGSKDGWLVDYCYLKEEDSDNA